MTTEERRQVLLKALRDANLPMLPAMVAEVVDKWEDDVSKVWNTAVEAGRMSETIPLWI